MIELTLHLTDEEAGELHRFARISGQNIHDQLVKLVRSYLEQRRQIEAARAAEAADGDAL